MKMVARAQFTVGAELAAFMARFGQVTNTISLLFALFGTQQLMKYVGVGWFWKNFLKEWIQLIA